MLTHYIEEAEAYQYCHLLKVTQKLKNLRSENVSIPRHSKLQAGSKYSG